MKGFPEGNLTSSFGFGVPVLVLQNDEEDGVHFVTELEREIQEAEQLV